MSNPQAVRLAAAAASLIGTRFRLHGRDPATGLDCVGLVGEALRRCGREAVLPRGYRLRMLDLAPWLHLAAANRLTAATGPIAAGDVHLVHLHHVQPHLLVRAGRADSGGSSCRPDLTRCPRRPAGGWQRKAEASWQHCC